jgi:superfamily II DNA or RNA helicase
MTDKLRAELFVVADGRSDASGAPLDPEAFEVDHIIPRAAGGTDEATNLRVTTPDENRAKAAACPPPLREWQAQFIRKWRAKTTTDFLLVALPGSGKTVAALSVAQEWVDAHPGERRVLIVVPTDALRTQWQEEAAQSFGLQFQTKEFFTFKSQYHGGIVTYQLLASQPNTYKRLCCTHDVLVICDEIHHAGDANEWGAMLREAVTPAARRLLMSGTPFRGDRTRIPFVDYDGSGVCVADDRYDYPRAIRDGVIRVVRFQHDKGIVRRMGAAGIEESPELNSDLQDDEASELLRPLLLTPGNYTEALLRAAHERLLECRRTMPSAGALALCIDQSHAERIARQLEHLIGAPVDLVVSDDDRATSTVKAFRASTRPWVVAVRQISEGVDIKRLMVLAYLTTTRSELFFRQAVGRIVRNQGTDYDIESYCFIPDHPTLVRHAQHITEAQAQAIEDDPEDPLCRGPRDDTAPRLWPIVIGTDHTGMAGSIIEGERLAPDDAMFVQQVAREEGAPEHLAWRLFRRFRAMAPPTVPVSPGIRTHVRPLEDQETAMRQAVLKATQRAAYRLTDTPDFAHVNHLINTHIGKRRELFTLDDCRRAILFADALKKVVES